MKRKIIKFVYVVMVPLMVITMDILLFVGGQWQYHWEKGSTELFIIMGILHLCAIGAAVSFSILQEKTRLLPSRLRVSQEPVFAFGFAWEKEKLALVLPFYVLSADWRSKPKGVKL